MEGTKWIGRHDGNSGSCLTAVDIIKSSGQLAVVVSADLCPYCPVEHICNSVIFFGCTYRHMLCSKINDDDDDDL